MFKKRISFEDQVVWLTGASYGLGASLAKALSARGAKLILSARSEDKLAALAATLPTEVLVAPLDVTDLEANKQVVQKAVAHFGRLDVAIFNAGTSDYTDIQSFDALVFDRLMKINYSSMMYGLEAALPELKQSAAPYIVGMSSVAGYRGLPRGEAYGASKAAIRYVLEGLRIHFKMMNQPMEVSIVCPGFVKTPLTDKNDFAMPMIMPPEKAADIIARGLERRKLHIHFPWVFSSLLRLVGLLPSRSYAALLAWALKARV